MKSSFTTKNVLFIWKSPENTEYLKIKSFAGRHFANMILNLLKLNYKLKKRIYFTIKMMVAAKMYANTLKSISSAITFQSAQKDGCSLFDGFLFFF